MREAIKKVIGLDFGTSTATPDVIRKVEGFAADDEQRIAVLATSDKLSQQWAPRWLEHVGMQVRTVCSAEEARGAVSTACPDIILVDAAMRAADGQLLIDSLRRVHDLDIPIVALCSNAGEVMIAADSEVSDIVRRPFDWQVITQRAVRIVRAHETSAELQDVQARLDHLHDSTRAAEIKRVRNHGIDSLTNLPNAERFRNLSQKVAAGLPADHCQSSIVIGLGRFRQINDAIGRENANDVLAQFADRLKSCVADRHVIGIAAAGTVTAIVGRLGGARFAVHLANTCEQQAQRLQDRVQLALQDPFQVDGQSIYLTSNFGIASYPEHCSSPDELLDLAESALFKAQDEGVDSRTYDPERDTCDTDVLRLDSMLRDAIRNNELSVHYQPIMDSGLNEVVGAEALLRWEHPTEGRISPEVFVPIAENTGLMKEIGDFVIEESCAQLRRWLDDGMPAIRVAINLSLCQLTRGDVVSVIEAALERHSLPSSLLEVELSERGVMNCQDELIAEVRRLKDIGVRISIDDFGTGQAAIAYLKDLPIDVIKIDRSYVSGSARNSRNEAIASGMVALARRLNATVIAEGVETDEQLQMLRDWGSHECQGFYFSGAIPGPEFAANFGGAK